jgi:Ran GTPase-activating protein (RanGAP) involved in mRNA processing and transport
MGIIRGGDAEYNEFEPSYEEKAKKLEGTLKLMLEENSKTINLSGKYIAVDEVKIISNFLPMKSVRLLDLSDNQINDEALQYLFESEILSGLEQLYLQINFLTGKGLSELAKSEKIKLKNLRALVLSDNRLSDSSIAEFLFSSHFAELAALNIGWNEAGSETAKALGKTTTFPNLKKLEMERSYVDENGIREFVIGVLADKLEELDLSANKLNDEMIKILVQAPKWKSLKVFRVSQNRFGNEGAKALGESVSMSGLTHLYVGRNYFDSEGAQAIYESKTLKNLKTLVIKEEVDDGSGLVNYSRPELLRPDDPNAI